jgi:hypothetical protein
MDDNRSYLKALVALREQLNELYSASRNERQQQQSRWEEERGSLQDLIAALTTTRDIIKGEQKKVHDQLTELQQRLQRSGSSTDRGGGGDGEDVVDLQVGRAPEAGSGAESAAPDPVSPLIADRDAPARRRASSST